jgi:hypothetical protein
VLWRRRAGTNHSCHRHGPPGRLIAVRIFAASGTYIPTPGMNICTVDATGGGAGASGTPNTTAQNAVSGGGGSGSRSVGRFTAAQIGASQAVTIGAGGPGGIGAAVGGAGGTTSFGALMVVPGALAPPSPAVAATSVTAGISAGGNPAASPTGGSIFNSPGSSGQLGVWSGSGICGGAGAPSPLTGGGGGNFTNTIPTVGNPGLAPGAGGSGVCASGTVGAKNGGAGAAGFVTVYEWA